MAEAEFNQFLGYLSANTHSGEEFVEIVNRMVTMLDHTDADDYFGTEGWRRDFGWEQ